MRFSIKHLLIVVSILALVLGIYLVWLRDVVTISAASVDEEIHTDYYFGIDDRPAEITNILNISGVFKKRTRLHANLYLVRNGSVENVTGFSVGRSPNRIGEPWLVTMDLTLALADRPSQSGTTTQLGCYGQTRGGGGIGYAEHDIDCAFTESYNGTMSHGQNLIVYVTGDTEFDFDPNTSIEDFAKANTGEYLVVVSSLN